MGKQGGNPVLHCEILCQNAESLWEFYRTMFGWAIDGNTESNYGMVGAT